MSRDHHRLFWAGITKRSHDVTDPVQPSGPAERFEMLAEPLSSRLFEKCWGRNTAEFELLFVYPRTFLAEPPLRLRKRWLAGHLGD
jgi:hypothetical protein